jgi:MarR family transcriptional regulator, organic hydroperoxide resistance regulator
LAPNYQEANVTAVTPEEMRACMGEDPLIRLIPLAGNVVSQRLGRIFGRQSGLTPAGAAVLSILQWGAGRGFFDRGEPGRATSADLARRSLLAPATVTGIVDTLEKAGYVLRERDTADRRITWIVITDAGRERVSEIGKQTQELLNTTEAEKDPEKVKIIRDFLIELISNHYDKE